MFEQSILSSAPAARKTGAVFASFLAQIAAVGVIICVPLIYSDVLPRIKLTMPLFRPVAAPPQAPVERVSTKSAVTTGLHTASAARIFQMREPSSTAAPADFLTIDADPVSSFGTHDLAPLAFPDARPLPAPERPRPTVVDAPKPTAPVPVGGNVQSAKILKRVIPIYPAPARQARISGTVRLTGIIAKDGTVQKLEVVSGNPFLVQAALDAVRQWIYQPTYLNGQPVEVIAPIDIVFTLQ
jgi:protein TonB